MKTPVWELLKDGTDNPVAWIDHKPNPRFAIYNSGTAANQNDDLVLDKETGLIWPRNANGAGMARNWLDANTGGRQFRLANRIGWRLPTVEELSSLVDTRNTNPALPTEHPFIAVQCGAGNPTYWTSTDYENPGAGAWFVNLGSGDAGLGAKTLLGFSWPVRGGRSGVSWNW